MNNPIRAAVQRFVEVRRLLRLGGAVKGGAALEIGCGRGVGAQLVIDHFGVASVDAFDLDVRMVRRAFARSRKRGANVRLWVGDATSIAAASGSYDAVFDFGILHHVPDWRGALREVSRVLKPNGRFYCEEVLRPLITHPVSRWLVDHPQEDRFDALEFREAFGEVGLAPIGCQELWGVIAWFVAEKAAAQPAHEAGERERSS